MNFKYTVLPFGPSFVQLPGWDSSSFKKGNLLNLGTKADALCNYRCTSTYQCSNSLAIVSFISCIKVPPTSATWKWSNNVSSCGAITDNVGCPSSHMMVVEDFTGPSSFTISSTVVMSFYWAHTASCCSKYRSNISNALFHSSELSHPVLATVLRSKKLTTRLTCPKSRTSPAHFMPFWDERVFEEHRFSFPSHCWWKGRSPVVCCNCDSFCIY